MSVKVKVVPVDESRAIDAVKAYWGRDALEGVEVRERVKRAAVANALGCLPHEVEGVLWKYEPVAFPGLAIDLGDLETVEGRLAAGRIVIALREGRRVETVRRIPGEAAGMRWERLAFRSGVEESKLRVLAGIGRTGVEDPKKPGRGKGAAAKRAARDVYVGRGRRFDGMTRDARAIAAREAASTGEEG